jgi:hypothetical protein
MWSTNRGHVNWKGLRIAVISARKVLQTFPSLGVVEFVAVRASKNRQNQGIQFHTCNIFNLSKLKTSDLNRFQQSTEYSSGPGGQS